ncbi:MAG: glycosyltransferase family 4 protein [Verrucomicrobia bacterium]|nr:glycosyltransferase family 4 protein [Verrucomicrobiota bacterium]
MKILVVTNLFPPHQADTDDFRCQNVTDALRERGHTVRVLTSTYGLASDSGHTARNVGSTSDQQDSVVQRRLRLNGAFGLEPVSGLGDLRELEARNNLVLREAIAEFAPDLIHVWSLRGLSKSLLLTLRRANIPTALDVSDTWLADELREDPWLSWWHREKVPAMHKVQRAGLELSGQRTKWDAEAPTFIEAGTSRLPAIFDPGTDAGFKPNSFAAFQLRRLHFSSPALQTATAQAGFRVAHGEVIHPGVDTRLFHGEVKPADAPVKKFLIVTRLTPHCGVRTAIEAIRLVRAQGAKATLTVHGRGNSEVQAKLRTQAVQGEVPVEFRASSQQRDFPGIYRAHDAFIYPVEREESFVGAPLEAMACGLPVIVNQDHGAEDLFRSRESCLSFPSGDSGLLANRILELIQTPNLANQLAQVGQNEVLTRYQFTNAVEQIERYLDDTVAQW